MQYLVWLVVTLLYVPVFKVLYLSRWETVDYTHAYFILPVSLWFAWRQRRQLRSLAAEAAASKGALRCGPGYVALSALGLLMYVFGHRQDYLFISTLSLIPVLAGLTGYLYGGRVTRTLAFPILYLLLLVPPPLGVLDALTLPMRHWISVLTHSTLAGLRYPITRDGLLLSVGGAEIYMGSPCSGFRSLVTMISLGLAYAAFMRSPLKHKMILVGSVVPLALLGNYIRVTSMCLVTFHFGGEAGHRYHDMSGFVIFIILIAGMLGIEHLLNQWHAPSER